MAAKDLTENYIVKKLDELPTLPSIVYELNEVINDPMSSTKDVEKIMSNDISMTTKVLKLANSAYYAIPGGVSSLSRAIAYIGFDSIQQLVLSASILQALEVNKVSDFNVNEFWKHSIGVGIAAETLAKYLGHPLPSDLFTCGLVHDMGKVALYSIDSEAVDSIVNHAIENEINFYDAESELSYPVHTEIGVWLADKWLLPNQLRAAIKYHHQLDDKKRGGLSAELNKVVDIVYISNLLIHALKFGNSGHNKILGAPKTVMMRLMLSPEKDFKKLLLQIKDNLSSASGFIDIIGGKS